MSDPTPHITSKSGLSENVTGAIAYITFIPALLFLLIEPYNKNAFVRFHAFQSLLLCLAAVVIDVALSVVLALVPVFVPFLHFALWQIVQLFWLAVWIVCIVGAYNGRRTKLPVIGLIAEQQSVREGIPLH